MKKAAKKQNMINKKGIILLSASLILTVSVLGLGYDRMTAHKDSRKFVEISEDKSAIAGRVEAYLKESVVAVRDKKECFNTGQGPYDNGYLWCQTSSIFELKNDINPQELGSEFLKAGSSLGTGRQATGYELPLYVVELYGGTKCHLGIKLSSGDEVSGARKNPFNSNFTDSVVAVTCGDRAKLKHYQYADS